MRNGLLSLLAATLIIATAQAMADGDLPASPDLSKAGWKQENTRKSPVGIGHRFVPANGGPNRLLFAVNDRYAYDLAEWGAKIEENLTKDVKERNKVSEVKTSPLDGVGEVKAKLIEFRISGKPYFAALAYWACEPAKRCFLWAYNDGISDKEIGEQTVAALKLLVTTP